MFKRLWDWIFKFLLGDDIFISYSRADGATYAAGLASKLAASGYSCKLDQWGTEATAEMPESLKKSLRRSAVLVLVGTPGAAKSSHVNDEIVSFKKTKRMIVPIIFDGVLLANDFTCKNGKLIDKSQLSEAESNKLIKAEWANEIIGLPISVEKIDALVSGTPTINEEAGGAEESVNSLEVEKPNAKQVVITNGIVSRIENTFTFSRKDERLKKTSRAVAAVLLVLLIASGAAFATAVYNGEAARQKTLEVAQKTFEAQQASQLADDAKNEATAQQQAAKEAKTAADTAKANAEEQKRLAGIEKTKADKAAALAHEQTKLAQEKAELAERKNKEAIAANELAQKNIQLAEVAKTEAEKQQKIALSREQASKSFSQLRLDPESSVLFANRAFAAYPTEEAKYALRTSLFESHIKTILREGHGARVHDAHFSKNRNIVITGGDDGNVVVWNAQNGQQITKLSGSGYYLQSSFSPDEKYIAAVDGSGNGSIQIWDWTKEQEKANPRYLKPECTADAQDNSFKCSIKTMSFSSDGKYIAGAGNLGTIWVWRVEDGKLIKNFSTNSPVNNLAFSPDPESKFIAAGGAQGILWEWNSDVNPRYLDSLGEISDIKFNSTGEFLLAATNTVRHGNFAGIENGEVWVWSLSNITANPLERLEGNTDSIWTAEFSPDSSLIVSAGEDGTARIWNWRLPERTQIILRGHSERVRTAKFSSNGEYVVTSSDDGTARLWKTNSSIVKESRLDNIAETQSIAILRGHTGGLWTAEFSFDDKYVVTASEDKTARIWTTPIENIEAEFSNKTVAMSSDEKLLVTADNSNRIQVWDWSTKNLSEPLADLESPNADVFDKLVFSNDGNYVAAIAIRQNQPDAIAVWDWRNKALRDKPIILPGNKSKLHKFSFSRDADSRYIVATNGSYETTNPSQDNVIRVWDWRDAKERNNPTVIPPLPNQIGPPTKAVFSSDNKYIISTNSLNVCIWDWKAKDGLTKPLILQDGGRYAFDISISSNDEYIAAGGMGEAFIWKWKEKDGYKNPVRLKFSNLEAKASAVDFTKDNEMLLTAASNGTINLWNVGTGEMVTTLGVFDAGSTGGENTIFSKSNNYIIAPNLPKRTKKNYYTITARIYRCDLCGNIDDLFQKVPNYISPQSVNSIYGK